MELIAMRCTREQYESIAKHVGPLTEVGAGDFKIYHYLCNYENGTVKMNNSCRIKKYETFDKDIFLKACGINPNAALFNKVREHFKDAEDCVSLLGGPFKMSEYDLNNLEIGANLVYAKKRTSHYQRQIYDIDTGHFAAILPKVSPAEKLVGLLQDISDFKPWPQHGVLDFSPWSDEIRENIKQVLGLDRPKLTLDHNLRGAPLKKLTQGPKIDYEALKIPWKVHPPIIIGSEPVRLTRKQIEAILGYKINIIQD
jgi:hypothetical protein